MHNQALFLLKAAQIETPLGIMVAIADDQRLYFLDFVNRTAILKLNQSLSVTAFGSSLGKWDDSQERWHPFHYEECHLPRLERKIKRLRTRFKAQIMPGKNAILESIEEELALYFEGKISFFKTPYELHGSSFQQEVWETLLKIPYGKTQSYAEEASAMGKPAAVRAVANANGANQLAIVIPCHRVVGSNGGIGGYGSGLKRKKWLLDLEQQMRVS